MENLLDHHLNGIGILWAPPSCYPYTVDRRTHVPVVSYTPTDLDSQQLVYILILRRAYQNPPPELLHVFNSLFNPPIETYEMPGESDVVIAGYEGRAQTTLEEWEAVWAGQTALPKDDQGMKDELVRLQQKRDYVCVRNVGGIGRWEVMQRYLAGYGSVERVITAAAERAKVVLVKRLG